MARATRRSDTLIGTAGPDVIDGRGGDDVIWGFDPKAVPAIAGIRADRVGSGLAGAVFAGAAPGRPDDLFVVQKDLGRIAILDVRSGAVSTFLEVPAGEIATGGEQGLLGLAFHPGYAANGRFFVHLVNAAGDIEIREYARSPADPERAAPDPVRTLLTVPHPVNANHNGGALAFGPRDGYLYVALGDGGGANDPGGNGQNINTLLGSILRLDVDRDGFPADPARNYANPADNPFVGRSGADEIWAYGLRNPWRIGFDRNGDLYIGDVGQAAREELDFQPAAYPGGANYGWDLAEGTLGRPPPGAVPPVFEYGRDLGATIIGGYVYRGAEPALQGRYFFADFISGAIWSLRMVDGAATEVTERTAQVASPEAPLSQITSFGVDATGELYLVTLQGDIFRLDPVPAIADSRNVLRGGSGDDRIFGGPAGDRLRGDAGSDELHGGPGRDRLRGDQGRDAIFGDEGSDWLSGGSGRDRLHGGPGDDELVGGSSPDRLSGDDGNDRLLGGPGRDRLHGGPGDDALRGGGSADRLFGDDGNDRLLGGSGRDRLHGGPGDDALRGGGSADRLFGDDGNDRLVGGSGRDRLEGGFGADNLRGNSGSDVLRGGPGNDALRGDGGADRLVGGAGDDLLIGGPGGDRFVFHARQGDDRIGDFGEGDRLDLSAFDVPDFGALAISATGASTLVDLADRGGGSILLENVARDSFGSADVLL